MVPVPWINEQSADFYGMITIIKPYFSVPNNVLSDLQNVWMYVAIGMPFCKDLNIGQRELIYGCPICQVFSCFYPTEHSCCKSFIEGDNSIQIATHPTLAKVRGLRPSASAGGSLRLPFS